jgi:hypothetical protein
MLFLVPLAVVGYSAWKQKQQRQQDDQRHRSAAPAVTEGGVTIEPSVDTSTPAIGSALTTDSLETLSLGGSSSDGDDIDVVEPDTTNDVLGGSADDLTCADDEAGALDVGFPGVAEDDNLLTDETKHSSDPQGPFHGLLSFIQEQQKLFAENQDPWSIKSNRESLTYEVLGHKGKRKLPLSM